MILFKYLDEGEKKDKPSMLGNKKLSKIVAFKKPIKNEKFNQNAMNR